MTARVALWMLLCTALAALGCKPRHGTTTSSTSTTTVTPATDKRTWGLAVAASFQRRAPHRSATFDETAFELAYVDQDMRGFAGLQSFWDDKISAEETAELIHRGLVNSPSSTLPCLRERAKIDVDIDLRRQVDPALRGGNTIPNRLVSDTISLALMSDRTDSAYWVSDQRLREQGTTFEESLARATRTLLQRRPPTMTTLQAGAYRFDGDLYASTQFVFAALESKVDVAGDPVAIFVSNVTVLVTGSEDVDGQRRLLQDVAKEVDKPHAWTPRFLRRTQAGWVVFAGTPIADEVRRRGVLADYTRQTALFRRFARDTDPFAAEALAVQSPKTSQVYTLATLTETVDTLLPEVDLVNLALWENGKARHLGQVRFDVLQRTLGSRMKREAYWPPRYRVTTFPSAAERKAMEPSLSLP
jgi:hypothetical protein